MEKSSSKARGLGRIAAVAVLGLASAFGAYGVGYLSKIGPNPLRLQAPHASAVSNLPPLLMDNSDIAAVKSIPIKPSEDIKMVAGANRSGDQLPRLLSPSPVLPNLPGPSTGSDSMMPDWGGSTANSKPRPSTASDLLTVTPQMLVDYFRPQRSTNGASISVLAPMSFAPAVPSAPDSSSAYKTP